MAVLTKEIAQDIVDQTMNILSYNINVMDRSGVIIGSGDQSRIGEMHEGAMNAIVQKRRVDIAVDQMKNLAGTKPGINLPIILDRKSTRLNSSHVAISYAVFCLKKNINF